ncbi:hypothetical protein SDC9_192338 [bioreactor metagenome]|uniref:Uncharacterized protein n=1 Tax=bioreactor metagenome TaxID=1076179 RepID=A0A645IBG7_9ZZZZ
MYVKSLQRSIAGRTVVPFSFTHTAALFILAEGAVKLDFLHFCLVSDFGLIHGRNVRQYGVVIVLGGVHGNSSNLVFFSIWAGAQALTFFNIL